MAVIKPFKGVRPVSEIAHLVASVPYDVVNKEEAAVLAKYNPLSFLRISRAEIELESGVDIYSERVYQKAKDNFERLRTEAPLIQDETPHFYAYRLKMGEQTQIGIAAVFSIDDYDNNIILKHEKTRKVKEDDRTNHIISTKAQTGPVFLTYKGVEDINHVIKQTIEKNEPIYDFTAPDGIEHTIWIIPDDYTDIIVFEISKVKNLYIADGHHRAASAARAQKALKENMVNQTGEEDYNFFLAVLFPAEQLKILPYNRVVLKVNNVRDFMRKVKLNFTVEKTESPSPAERRSISMYWRNKWFRLIPNENVTPGKTLGENLDVSILQDFLLRPILRITDPRTDNNIDFIGGIRGTAELEKLVKTGKGEVAFSMYPVNVDDLIAISDAGETMPPKSTWFEPKLRDGLLIHTI